MGARAPGQVGARLPLYRHHQWLPRLLRPLTHRPARGSFSQRLFRLQPDLLSVRARAPAQLSLHRNPRGSLLPGLWRYADQDRLLARALGGGARRLRPWLGAPPPMMTRKRTLCVRELTRFDVPFGHAGLRDATVE